MAALSLLGVVFPDILNAVRSYVRSKVWSTLGFLLVLRLLFRAGVSPSLVHYRTVFALGVDLPMMILSGKNN